MPHFNQSKKMPSLPTSTINIELTQRVESLAPKRPNALRSSNEERVAYLAQMELLGRVLEVLGAG